MPIPRDFGGYNQRFQVFGIAHISHSGDLKKNSAKKYHFKRNNKGYRTKKPKR